MRIPSELHSETLYGRASARPPTPPGQSWRRVIRLIMVLTLILIAMRQATRSGVYQAFFPASVHEQRTTRHADANATKTVTSQHAPEMTQLMRSEFDAWAEEKSIDEISTQLARWLVGHTLEIEANGVPIPQTPDDQSRVALAMQQKLIAAMKDGTVWRAADGPGLMATLAMHDDQRKRFETLNQARPRTVTAGVLPLLQQPNVYRGRTMIASGELVRIEKLHASDNPFSISAYWNLWLLPHDASNRPWLVIVPELPPEMAPLVNDQTLEKNLGQAESDRETVKQSWSVKSPRPQIEVDGEFLKRLSYQSAAGAELTPVVAGHVASIDANGNPVVGAAIGQSEPGETQQTEATEEIPPLWIVVGAVAAGLLIAIGVMWRTATLNRRARARRNRRQVTLGIAWIWFAITAASPASAQSMWDLLPAYNAPRMQTLTQNAEPTLGSPQVNIDELAKIVFRMNRLSETALQSRVARSATPPIVGDAVVIDGEIVAAEPLTIGTELQEYLELTQIEMIRLADIGDAPHVLFSHRLPRAAVASDRISGVAVRIRVATPKTSEGAGQADSEQARHDLIIDVAGRLNWTSAHPQSPADAVLAMAGVDLSRLAEIGKLDRQPLSDADSPLFYPMMGAARIDGDTVRDNAQLSEAVRSMRKSTRAVSPVDLLQSPQKFTGQWIRLDVETVRITRVAVESSQRRSQIGGDFYYEIDAIGNLGNVELKIEVPGGEPVTMENRYPVTIVTAQLPDFLKPPASDKDQLVLTRRVPIGVEGFFYRLWSYESDLMQSHGGKQFAPLILAGVIEDERSGSSDPHGVQEIGNIAAVAVIAAIVAMIIFGIVTRRGDRRARDRKNLP